jgi:thiol-disulfide isomerase/thioredoxin
MRYYDGSILMRNTWIVMALVLSLSTNFCRAAEPADKSDEGQASTLAEKISAIAATHRQRRKEFYDELDTLAQQRKELGAAEYGKQVSRANLEYSNDARPMAQELIALIKANRQQPAVIEGLIALEGEMSHSLGVDEQLVQIAIKDQLANPEMGRLCSLLRYSNNDPAAEAILRAVAKEHPMREVRGMATYGLGEYFRQTARDDWGRPITPEQTTALLADAEKQFVDVLENYADVLTSDGKNLRDLATSSLARVRNIPHLTVGQPAPLLRGESVDGAAIDLADYRGKVVLIVFWGSWCGPCMRMVPHERELVERWKDQPFVLLGVNCGDDRQTAQRTIAAEQMQWASLWDGDSNEGPAQSAFNVLHWPTVYVLDAAGTIRAIDPKAAELDSLIEKLLASIGEAGSDQRGAAKERKP